MTLRFIQIEYKVTRQAFSEFNTMKITPSADDINTQSLKGINRASGEVKQADHVEPAPAIEAEERHLPKSALAHPERRKGQRRKQQRRKDRKAVLLDTRTTHEQRVVRRRHNDQVSEKIGEEKSIVDEPTVTNKGVDITT